VRHSNELPAIGAATVGGAAGFTAAVAGACCVGSALAPVFVSILGASGLAAVSGLRPYTPWLLGFSAALLAFSFRQVYWTFACTQTSAGKTVSLGVRAARCIVWIAACFWCFSAAYAVYGLLHE